MSAPPPSERILLKPREAAELLAVSERQLWSQTSPRGPIPSVRIGHCVRYCHETLRQFVGLKQQKAATPSPEKS